MTMTSNSECHRCVFPLETTAHTHTHINTRRNRSRVPRSPRRPSSTTFLLIVHTDTYHYFSTLCPARSMERAGAALPRPGGTVGRDHHREQPTTTRTMRSKQSESFAILSPSLAASSLLASQSATFKSPRSSHTRRNRPRTPVQSGACVEGFRASRKISNNPTMSTQGRRK